ncbi:MAG: restriction endonuclease [Candidatus Melainabacteria bacterium]
MTIPMKYEITKPLLEYASKQNDFRMDHAIDALAEHFQLTDAERREMYESGNAKRFDNRVYFARLALCKAGLLESTGKKLLKITTEGKRVLSEMPESIDHHFLLQFPGYAEVWENAKAKTKLKKLEQSEPSEIEADNELTSENSKELIEIQYKSIRKSLSQKLLEQLTNASPRFFEKIVVDLLVKMGYGGSRKDAGESIGRVGDEGIDGIIKEDKLGLDVIYIQAKRYAVENTIGRPAIQGFSGSLDGKRAKKGVFITTSTYSREALEYANNIEKKIILIDGNQLTQLMIDHNVGVSDDVNYSIKKLDHDYFEEELV